MVYTKCWYMEVSQRKWKIGKVSNWQMENMIDKAKKPRVEMMSYRWESTQRIVLHNNNNNKNNNNNLINYSYTLHLLNLHIILYQKHYNACDLHIILR